MADNAAAVIVMKLEDDYRRLRETIARIPAARLAESGDGGGWSAREILAHLANAERDHRRVAEEIVAGRPVHLPDFDLDRWNQAGVARRAGQPVEAILDDLEAEHRFTLAFATALSPNDLAKQGYHPALGEITVGKLLRVVGLHQRMHQRDLAALAVAASND